MIYSISDAFVLPKEVKEAVGNASGDGNDAFFKVTGSCLYNLRLITLKNQENTYCIKENARCNFEKFPLGYLLRINDVNKLYVLPLPYSKKWKINIVKGEESIQYRSLTYLLLNLGVKRSFLKKYWILSRGFYYSRLKLEICSDDFQITFDANGSEYKSALKYFELNPKAEV